MTRPRRRLIVRKGAERRAHRPDLLVRHRDGLGPRPAGRPLGQPVEVRVLTPGPEVVDDRVPGQPKEPAPKGDPAGLDEDDLGQVLRVARMVDTAGDVPVDRLVVVVEQATERIRVPISGLLNEPLDRGVVDGHNEEVPAPLGRGDAPRQGPLPLAHVGRNRLAQAYDVAQAGG